MKVFIKWRAEKIELDLDVNESPLNFKAAIFSATNVPVERQKLLLKGIQIKDDTSWSSVSGLKEGTMFMLLGTVGDIPQAPPIMPIDSDDSQRGEDRRELSIIPPGFVNLGNTCYLNATLQCLSIVEELKTSLSKDVTGYSQDIMKNIAVAFRDLYKQLDKSQEAVPPLAFLTNFRVAFPQFAQQDSRGNYAQQDAEEAWNQLLSALKQSGSNSNDPNKNIVENVLGIEFVQTSTCDNPDAIAAGETSTQTVTRDLRITCHISNQVNNVLQSITEGLTQKVEKNSPTLGRLASYSVTSKINRLPKYLTVHFARFFWRSDIKQRVKIRRNVAYSMELDMYQYCTSELQSKLSQARDHGKVHPDLASDQGCNVNGYYDLCAVLTHIGSSSDSGHYIGWVRKSNNKWFKFDDDKVMEITEADVLKNSGSSADGHIAYLLLYRAKAFTSSS